MTEILVKFLFLLPIISIMCLLAIEKNNLNELRLCASVCSFTILIITLLIQFGISVHFEYFSYSTIFKISDHFNIYYSIGIDGLSYYLLLLTTLLTIICIVVIWEIKVKLKEFLITLFTIEFLLLNVFCSIDLLFFYIFFEAILIPMFIMIGLWGARERKIQAAYRFFLYTFFGSIFLLIAIIYIYTSYGTTYSGILTYFNYIPDIQKLVWLGFFISLAVKVPMFPVHLWLPEAHTEAPTAGSVLLAGILLKMGTYGILRFLLPFFPFATTYFTPAVFTICCIGIIYMSLTALRQGDLKKAIAYSSVAHMSLVIIGLFTNTLSGIKGATFLMISHGIVSSALFIVIGVIYDRYKTRNLRYYGGLALVMPLFATTFLIQILSNMGFPGTSGFIGEFLILLLAFNSNSVVAAIATTGVILSAAYSVWLYNRVCFGAIKQIYIKYYADINEREFGTLLMLSIFTLILGMYPNIILNAIDSTLMRVIIQ